jgi:hypothetical protein
MSKLYELLQGVIQKVNKSVSTEEQKLTDEQKLQVKTNLGISDSTGVNADWNQNNESASDYIKGRTHWKEAAVTEILPLTTFTEGSGGVSTQYPSDFIKPADTIVFIIDGVEYSSDAVSEGKDGEVRSTVLIDNVEFIISNGMAGDEDFHVYTCDYSGTYFSTHPQVQVQVIKTTTTYHTLSDKYIPETIARLDEVQGDWDVHDYTDPQYIYNRPFYHKPSEDTVVYTGTLSPTTDGQSIPVSYLEHEGYYYSVQIGKEWLYNGIPVKGADNFMGCYIGNLSLGYAGGENTGEVFLIAYDSDYQDLRVWLSADVINEYSSEVNPPYITMSLHTPEKLVKLNEKFLPDSVITISDAEMTQLEKLLNPTNTTTEE